MHQEEVLRGRASLNPFVFLSYHYSFISSLYHMSLRFVKDFWWCIEQFFQLAKSTIESQIDCHCSEITNNIYIYLCTLKGDWTDLDSKLDLLKAFSNGGIARF